MATYLQGVTDILPDPKLFTPDFSFIDKMMQRKSAQYEQGFAQLNNQYNLINRKVTNSANAEIRDNFLEAAKNNLKDLSTMDLSDPQNVKAATEVFKPFYSNSLVIGDQAFTAHLDKQEAIGESYRLKDGGKEFSEDNLTYLKMQRAAFAADDPASVSEYLANKKYYTPYHDYNKSIADAMKEFKPTHTKIVTINGMYKKVVEDDSWNKLEISKYLNSVLSDKDKQQMRIEASVKLGRDVNFLMNTYMATEGNKIPALTALIDKYNTQIKTETDPQKILQLKQNRDYYDDQRAEISNNLKMLKSGDTRFLKKNSEALAFKPYFDSIIDKKSEGYAHENVSTDIGIDEVQKLFYEQSMQNYRQRMGFAHDEKMESIKQDGENARKKMEVMKDYTPPIPIAGGPNEDVDFSMLGLKQRLNENEVAAHNLFIDISKDMATSQVAKKYGIYSYQDLLEKKNAGKVMNLFNEYISVNKDKDLVIKYTNANIEVNNTKARIESEDQALNNEIHQKIGTANYIIYRNYLSGKNRDASGRPVDMATINSIKSSADQIVKKYADEQRSKRLQSRSGFLLNAEHPVFKQTMGYFQQNFKPADVTGVSYFPSIKGGQGFDLTLSINNPDLIATLRGESVENKGSGNTYLGLTKQQLLDKYSNAYTPGRKVTFDPATNSLVFKGLGSSVAAAMDPYRTIPDIHRTPLQDIVDATGSLTPGHSTHWATIPNMVDALGKHRFVAIQTTKFSNGSPVTHLQIDGFKLNINYSDPKNALDNAQYLLSQARAIKNLDGSVSNSLDLSIQKSK